MKIPLAFAVVGTLCGVSWAQPAVDVPLAPIEQPKSRAYQVPIRNIKASVLAWWLDPINQKRPQGAVPARPVINGEEVKWGLPAGVERIVAVDPQNSLLVFSTPEGAVHLAQTIKFLDRPLRQVEIETRLFQVAADEVGKLGLNFVSPVGGPPFSRIKGNVTATLEALVARNKAVLLTAPRIVAFNNSTADLELGTGRGATWDVARPQGAVKLFANQEGFERLSQGTPLKVINNQSWQLTPTLNNDDTVTLLTEGEQRLELQGDQKASGTIVLERQPLPKFIVNLRDGETVAIEEQTLPASARTPATKTIVLFTPRIIRRVEE